MSDNPTTLGLIGCGGMMGAHRNGFRMLWNAGLRDFRIAACCDVDLPRAEAMADEIADFQGERPLVYSDYAVMLAEDPDLDAVDISTVHRNHHEIACACFEAGKHVTIEKPLAITLRAGKLMLDAAAKAGRLLQVAENYRRAPEQRAVKWALDEGRVGSIRMVYWVDVGERLWHWGWRDDRSAAGAGWSLDGGVHFADLFRYHVGPVRRMFALVRAYHPVRYGNPETLEQPIPADTEDATFAYLDFGNDVVGTWISTMSAPGEHWSRRVIYGEHGSIDWGSGLTLRGREPVPIARLVEEHWAAIGDDERDRLFPAGVTDTVATELWEFVQAVRGNATLETDGMEGYKAEAISIALFESQALGRPVDLEAEIESLAVEEYQRDLNEALGL